MFVSKRESASIHINEAFATDFVIHALACQVDELVDVVYLKKKEKIPPQNEIPQGLKIEMFHKLYWDIRIGGLLLFNTLFYSFQKLPLKICGC